MNLYDPSGFASIVYDPGPNPELAMDYEYWARKAAGYYDNSTTSLNQYLLYLKLSGTSTPDPEAVPPLSLSPAWPVGGVEEITSPFGTDYIPEKNRWRTHNGYDFAAPLGTAVVSSTYGTVSEVHGSDDNDFGIYVIVVLPDGGTLRYAHLSAVSVGSGQILVPGVPIGAVGNTGYSTAAHLHFEYRNSAGIAIDPYSARCVPFEPYLAPGFWHPGMSGLHH